MKTKRRNILIALVMSFAMMLSVMVVPDMGMRAEAKITEGGARIVFFTNNGNRCIFSNRNWYNEFMDKYEENDKVVKVKGATYDEATNTLTLKNFKHPTWQLEILGMGPGFKLRLVGKNKLEGIRIVDSEVTMCGKASVVINKSGWSHLAGIYIMSDAKAKLIVEKSVKLTVYKSTYINEEDLKFYPITVGRKKGESLASVKKRLVLKGKKPKFVRPDKHKAKYGSAGAWAVKGDVYKSW